MECRHSDLVFTREHWINSRPVADTQSGQPRSITEQRSRLGCSNITGFDYWARTLLITRIIFLILQGGSLSLREQLFHNITLCFCWVLNVFIFRKHFNAYSIMESLPWFYSLIFPSFSLRGLKLTVRDGKWNWHSSIWDISFQRCQQTFTRFVWLKLKLMLLHNSELQYWLADLSVFRPTLLEY